MSAGRLRVVCAPSLHGGAGLIKVGRPVSPPTATGIRAGVRAGSTMTMLTYRYSTNGFYGRSNNTIIANRGNRSSRPFRFYKQKTLS